MLIRASASTRSRIAKSGIDAQGRSIFSQNYIPKGVKGAAGNFFTSAIQQFGSPQKHLLGGFAGECQKKNRGRRNAIFHQAGNPVCECAGFTAAGPGNYKHRAFGGRDRLQLGKIELLFIPNTELAAVDWKEKIALAFDCLEP